MKENRKNTKDIIQQVSDKLHVEKQFVEIVADLLVHYIKKEYEAGNDVYISRLGTFGRRRKKATRKFNINIGLPVDVPEHDVFEFVPSKSFEKLV